MDRDQIPVELQVKNYYKNKQNKQNSRTLFSTAFPLPDIFQLRDPNHPCLSRPTVIRGNGIKLV